LKTEGEKRRKQSEEENAMVSLHGRGDSTALEIAGAVPSLASSL